VNAVLDGNVHLHCASCNLSANGGNFFYGQILPGLSHVLFLSASTAAMRSPIQAMQLTAMPRNGGCFNSAAHG
jgi:hypothetical protein